MQSKELHAVGELVGSAAAGVGSFIQETHQAIAGRPFGVLGIAAAPVRAIHDRVAGASYRLVGRALAAPPRAAAALIARALPDDAPPLARALPGE